MHNSNRVVREARALHTGDQQTAAAAANGYAPPPPPPLADGEVSVVVDASNGAASVAGSRASRRDARALWRIARRGLGLSFHAWDDDDSGSDDGGSGGGGRPLLARSASGRHLGYVVRVDAGARQPAPSWQRAAVTKGGRAGQVADLFVELLTGKGLGVGAALRPPPPPASSHAPSEPPGPWAPRGDAAAVAHMLTASWLNALLLCLPLGLWAGATRGDPTLVFVANFLALIPLALFLGEVTEDLAVRFGDTVGGLLNATFGNVVELFLSVAALHQGLYQVVAASLLGSILSNLLLVLGTCFLVGGMKFKEQRFSTLANKTACSLLFLACIGLIVPTTARDVYGRHVMTEKVLLHLSRAIALVLVAIYACYLAFQLHTHHDLFAGNSSDADDVPALSLAGAVACLAVITGIVALCSEYLTGAIEAVSERSGINQAFLGLIVLPIAGNVAEHVTAVFVAARNKMDLSIAVALGSSTQVATLIVPVTVLVGWAIGRDFTLDFDTFAVLMLTVAVILTYFVCSDGASNWLLGVQLIATYCLVGFVFLLEREPPPVGPGTAPPVPPRVEL